MNTLELINEASSLPVDERARIVDSLLQTLNPLDESSAAEWAVVASRRLAEIYSGQVQTVPGELVFEQLRQRLAGQ